METQSTFKTHQTRIAGYLALVVGLVALLSFPSPAEATRIKDIADVQGVRDNQLMGYGLVVGLDGTGDYGQSEFTMQSVASMLSRMGIKIDKDRIRTRNAAAVMVTADLPPFARSGQKLDVVVSSMGNARSLQGGTLLMTPLKGPDQKVYAMAQGPLSVGGYQFNAGAGNSEQVNHVTTGRVPNGAIVERGIDFDINNKKKISFTLQKPDFSTSVNIAKAINKQFPDQTNQGQNQGQNQGSQKPFEGIATPANGSTVEVDVPDQYNNKVSQFIAIVEQLEVERDRKAKVVINERTGTVVLGGDVEIDEVAVAKGNLEVSVSTQYAVSQPAPFGEGETRTVPQQQMDVQEGEQGKSEDEPLNVVQPEGAKLNDVVSALNAIGASPRELISILQAIKSAGALNATIEIQ